MLEVPARETNRPAGLQPFFSICVPQHNRTDFLILACESLARQIFNDFEICISDDCSSDGKELELLGWLRRSGLTYVYARTISNLGYDGNLRNVIGLSAGRYLFLMGNDDGLI